MGNYIFISYAHKDKDKVEPIIKYLEDSGLEVWYDKGIEVGTEWGNIIANKLIDCRMMIAFISPSYVESPNCNRETTFAVAKNKPAIVAYLEPTALTPSLELNLCTWQAIYRNRFNSDAAFAEEICKSQTVRGGISIVKTPTLIQTNNFKAGSEIKFGNYRQGQKGEVKPIEWQVLENDGTSALLISKYALDCKKYHNRCKDITWEKCDLRNWLNKTFINTAFTKEEQDKIKLSEVTADINPQYEDTPQGNNTNDKIFLLSINEVNKYFSNDTQKAIKGTPYCYKRGASKNSISGTCWWWLRSSGSGADGAADVHSDGSVYYRGIYVDGPSDAVRPALRINL